MSGLLCEAVENPPYFECNIEEVLAVNIQRNFQYTIFQRHSFPYDQTNPLEVGLCMTDMFFVMLESIIMMKKALVSL